MRSYGRVLVASALGILLPAALAWASPRPVGGALETICRVNDDDQETTVSVSPPEADRLLASSRSYAGMCETLGVPAHLGEVEVRVATRRGAGGEPLSLGIRVSRATFATLPQEPADGQRCLDLDDDGQVDVGLECVGGHERVLFLPEEWVDSVRGPFQWALVNWNPQGHGPQGVWTVAHFDFHFFIQSLSERNRIRIGRCAMLVDCDDLARGRRPVDGRYLPAQYEDRGVVEFGMGNHLIDPATFGSREASPDHTLVYGAWDGAVSFIEPMITASFLESVAVGRSPSTCYPIPRPTEVAHPGFWPTVYCVRYRANRDEFLISLEEFEYRSLWQDRPEIAGWPG